MTCRRTLTLAALALSTGLAGAQTSPYFIGLSQTFSRDNNLLRLADGQAAPVGYSRADSVSSTALLAGFDQTFGRQRGYANLALRSNRYGDNAVFNNTGYTGTAGLEWSTVERVSGSLTSSASRSLQRFESPEVGFLAEKNLESAENLSATVRVGMVTEYSLELSGGYRRVHNSLQQDAVQAREYTQNTASLGGRWQPGAATTLGLSLVATKGRYPKFRAVRATGAAATDPPDSYESDRFSRNDVELNAAFRPTGASSFDARISSGKTTYDLNQQRNFSGVTGSLGWVWQATAKLRLSTRYNRDTGQDSYATSILGVVPATADYSRVNSIWQVQTSWEASAKISVTLGVSYYDRNVVRTIANPILPLDADGRDRTTVYTLGTRWAPLRNALLGCDYSNDQRRASGSLTSPLHGNTFGCYGQINLQ
jgi:hypothetical protein